MAADGLAIQQQRRDRLAERPGELAVGAGLALIDLRAFGVQAGHECFSLYGDGVREGCFRAHACERPESSTCRAVAACGRRYGTCPLLSLLSPKHERIFSTYAKRNSFT